MRKTNHHITGSFRCTVATTLMLTLGCMSISTTAEAKGKPSSSKVAKTALHSDLTQARADYLLAIAKAQNLSDKAEQKEEQKEARSELRENSRHAFDVYEARTDLAKNLGENNYDPEIDPDNFLSPEDAAADPNPYFRLIPGLVTTYEGETEDGTEVIVVTVTEDTREILGVECTVVRDTVWVDGEIVEDTWDWYAQDTDGNVWYFGELSFEYEDGEISAMTGSWEGGVDGAIPGITMLADPVVGQYYRQEFLLGEAEDAAYVIALDADVSVPYGDFFGVCLQTGDLVPLDPEVLEHKFYAPGIGLVLELDVETGERVELISVVTP